MRVGALGAFTVYESPLFIYVVLLAAAQFALVIISLLLVQRREIYLILFWLGLTIL